VTTPISADTSQMEAIAARMAKAAKLVDAHEVGTVDTSAFGDPDAQQAVSDFLQRMVQSRTKVSSDISAFEQALKASAGHYETVEATNSSGFTSADHSGAIGK
jgi:putative N-acetylmannosamine-6-phosphate epimerase